MADSPEQSDHTSIQARLGRLERGETHTPSLANFMGHEHQDKHLGIPFRLMDYVELVDWVGRQIRDDKLGHINNRLPVILERLSLAQQECLTLYIELESPESGLVQP